MYENIKDRNKKHGYLLVNQNLIFLDKFHLIIFVLIIFLSIISIIYLYKGL